MGSQNFEEYDYVVCGGGTAGCVIASRLAELPNVSVLLLEAGVSKAEVPDSAAPAATAGIHGSKNDWCINNETGGVFGDRKIELYRPKFISGSSGGNGTLCIRGTRHDFDAWGLDGWSGDEVFRYMAKAENFKGADWFKADMTSHGTDGPLLIAPHLNAPISDLVLQSYQSAGLPFVPDMFTTGNVPNGCGHVPRTIYRGVRSTAADYLEGSFSKPNVTIKTLSFVDKLQFASTPTGDLKVEGVDVLQKSEDGSVSKQTYRARKETTICGGAYGSPTVLLRSGIGPPSELQKHGIECRLAREGVGRNLEDHLINVTTYEVSKPELTTDHLVSHGDAATKSMQQWLNDKTGFMGQFPFGAFAFARLDERLKDSPLWQNAERKPGLDPMETVPGQPHIEFWNSECFSGKYMPEPLGPGKGAFAMFTELFSQRSRGRVTLKSTDPFDKPVVDHNYLSDPLDMLVFAEGCRLADEIAREGAGTKDVIAKMMPTSRQHMPETREEWEQEIRERAETCYHPGGTCKMGRANDPLAVVDSELRVLGVKGLRIADASIIPRLPCGHTQMTVYAIGEKAADMIKAAA